MRSSVRPLLDRLIAAEDDGIPALIVVDDYAQRNRLIAALQAEALVHGITLVATKVLEPPTTTAEADQALLLLVDADQTIPAAEFLDAHRERLRAWSRFTLVVVLRPRLPTFIQHAPAFFSLAKANLVDDMAEGPPEQSAAAVTQALAAMTQHTGLTPAEYCSAFRAGRISDTFDHNYWFHLASLHSETSDG